MDYEVLVGSTHLSIKQKMTLENQRYPKEIYRKMRGGMVIRCQLHKIAISRNQKKYEWNDSPNDTLPVIVRFSNLEETLIPFGEPIEKPTDKLIGQLRHSDLLKDFDCFLIFLEQQSKILQGVGLTVNETNSKRFPVQWTD